MLFLIVHLKLLVSSHQYLKELFETLGREKALGVGWVFFEELEQFIKHVNQGFFGKDNNALAEAAHKLKGASAMLGQDLLESTLAQLES